MINFWSLNTLYSYTEYGSGVVFLYKVDANVTDDLHIRPQEEYYWNYILINEVRVDMILLDKGFII